MFAPHSDRRERYAKNESTAYVNNRWPQRYNTDHVWNAERSPKKDLYAREQARIAYL